MTSPDPPGRGAKARWVVAGAVVLAAGVVVAWLAVPGPPPQPPTIGWLMATPRSAPVSRATAEAFSQAMRALGYVDGRNVRIDYRHADLGKDQLPVLAAELVASGASIIVTGSSDATQAAQQVTRTVPIVMAVSADPVAQGFVASMAKPGGNITGLSMFAGEMAAKRLEQLRELAPGISRVAVLRLVSPTTEVQWKATEAAARVLGLQLHRLDVQSGESPDLARLFDSAIRAKAEALVILADPQIARYGPQIAALALEHRIPVVSFESGLVQAGGLMSYGPNIGDLITRSASYVDKILKGAKPADLAVEQPTKFELVINQKTADALGLTIPPTLQPDEVIR